MHVASGSGNGRRKQMNFELNLIPFIDVLSTCICFLLVTAVFINLGSFHVSQAVGSEKTKQEDKRDPGSLTVSFGGQGDVRFELKGVKGASRAQSVVTIKGNKGRVDFARSGEVIASIASRHSALKTVLLMPSPQSKYDDLIHMMAQFKKSQMDQIGIAPL